MKEMKEEGGRGRGLRHHLKMSRYLGRNSVIRYPFEFQILLLSFFVSGSVCFVHLSDGDGAV